MGRKKDVEKEDIEKLYKQLTPEQRVFIDHVRAGRHDPVYFAENLLGIELHPGQKLWLWMTTGTQLEKAYEMGRLLHDDARKLWENREQFDLMIEKAKDIGFLKNILVPSNRWGKTLVTSVKHIYINF